MLRPLLWLLLLLLGLVQPRLVLFVLVPALVGAVAGLELVLALLDALREVALLQLLRRTLLRARPALLFEIPAVGLREAVGPERGLGGLVVALAATDEVADGPDGLGEGVDLVGDGELEALLDLALELADLIVVFAVEIAGAFGGLAVHAVAAVDQRQLGGGVVLEADQLVLPALSFKLHNNAPSQPQPA